MNLFYKIKLTAAFALGMALPAARTHAAPDTWKGTTQSWTTSADWSAGTPTGATNVTINNAGTPTVGNGVTALASALIIGDTAIGGLKINAANAKLADATAVLGNSVGSSGTVAISSGSWGSTTSLTVGNSGTGVLNMTSGTVNVGAAGAGTGVLTLGANAGSQGTLNFTGGTLQAGSVNGGSGTATVNFTNTSNISFAPQLTGSLNVNFNNNKTTTLTGSSNYSGTTTLTSDATVTVSGGQLHNDAGSTLIIGAVDNDFATLNITNGGYVSGSNVVIGNTANAVGKVIINSGTFNVTGTITAGIGTGNSSGGGNGSATIEVDSGGVLVVDSGTGVLVLGAAGDGNDADVFSGGQATLNYKGGTLDAGSISTSSDAFGSVNIYTNSFAPQITGPSDGNMTVSYVSGGTFVYSGSDSYSGGTEVTNGTTLKFDGGTFNFGNSMPSQVNIGAQDPLLTSNYTGSAIITNNAYVNASFFSVGSDTDSSGTLSMDSGTLAASDFDVGLSGTGVFTMTGGLLDNSNGGTTIGYFAGSSGSAAISSGTWLSTGFEVGVSGIGVLNVNGGQLASPGSFYIGFSSGTGTVNVNSGTVQVDELYIGNTGLGTLNVQGGLVTGTDPGTNNYIGANDADPEFGLGIGAINVSSGTLNLQGTLYLALGGSATLDITGGSVTTEFVDIGYYGDQGFGAANGAATISGGTWNTDNNIVVGDSGNGTLNVSGGVLSPDGGAGTIFLAYGEGSTGVLNFSGGTINAADVYGGSGTATVNFTTASGSTSTFTPALVGDLSVNQTGLGDTIITANESYSGSTSVSAGTLTVNGSITDSTITINGGLVNGSGTTGDVLVNSGGTLGGTLHSGNVTATAGAKVTAGDAPGSNTMTTLTLSGSATYLEEIVVPGGGSYTGPGNHPIAGTDYGQTTLTGPGSHQTALTLDSANSILQLNVTGVLPAGGIASVGTPYNPAGSNSTLDNYFILNLADTTDTISGKFAQVTLDGITFVTIDYSTGNLVDNSSVGTFTLGNTEWAITYTGNAATNSTTGGNAVTLTALAVIPEPSGYVLFALGSMGLILFAKRKKEARKSPVAFPS